MLFLRILMQTPYMKTFLRDCFLGANLRKCVWLFSFMISSIQNFKLTKLYNHAHYCYCFPLSSISIPFRIHHAAAAKSLQSCPTLCDPIDGSPPGSPVPGILQARTLEWVAISFSNAWKWKVKVTSLSRVRLLVTPWTAAYQAPPSMGLSRQVYWSGVPLPSHKYSQ